MTWAPVKFFWQHSLHGLSGSTEEYGHEAEKLLDGLEGTSWRATAQDTQAIMFDAGSGGSIDVDYFWMANHNLKGARVELQAGPYPFGSAWTEVRCGATQRSTHSAAVINGEMFVFGGYSTQSGALNDLLKYSPANDGWTEVQCGSTRRYGHSAAVVNGEMFVFGGYSWQGSYLNDLWKYNPISNAWTEARCGATRRMAHRSVVIGNEMYVFGGFSYQSSCLNDFWKYNPASDAWTQMASGATPRYYYASEVIAGEMYLFGGVSFQGSRLNDLWKYSPSGNQWTQAASGATRRRSPTAAVIGNEMHVFGGYDAQNSCLNDLWKYSPSGDQWTQLSSGATPRYDHSMVVMNLENIFVFGGLDAAGIRYNDLWRYRQTATSSDITVAVSPFSPVDNKSFVREFSSVQKRVWRAIISDCSTAPSIALMQWGQKTELGFLSVDVDPHAQEAMANINIGKTGFLSGVHEHWVQRNLRIAIEAVDDALYQKLDAWWNGNRLRNFMVAWESSSHGSDVWLMYPGPKRNWPMRVGGLCRNVEIDLQGRKTE